MHVPARTNGDEMSLSGHPVKLENALMQNFVQQDRLGRPTAAAT